MDSQLINKLREGDLSAFSQLVEKYKNFAYSTAVRIVKNKEEAEEVAQDAFIKVYQSIETFNEQSKFSTWLFRIVYNTAISRIRIKKLEYQSIEDNFESVDSVAVQSTIDNLELTEQRKIIDTVLEALPHEESTILTLYYLEEFAVKEISEMMGLSLSNVKVRLFRARKRFYEEINVLLKEEIETFK